ncbi:hypothetical protein V6N13_074313 [Hibiscus sabdariffa]
MGFQNQPRQNPQQNLPRQEYQQPNDYKTLESTLLQFMAQTSAYMARTDRFIQKIDAFMDRTEMKLQNQDARLKSLETQVGQISQILNTRPIGGFPSDTKVAKGATNEQCKAIATRSVKVLEPTNKQRGTTAAQTKTLVVIDTPSTADIPAEADEDHIDPTDTRSRIRSRSISTRTNQTSQTGEDKVTPAIPTKAEETETILPVQEVL